MELNFYRKRKQWGRYLLSLVLSLLLAGNGLATPFVQDVTVTGRVTSAEDGYGIPGVNVVVKGTQTGTITDAEGRYSLSVGSSNAVLIFSSIGFESQEVPVSGRSTIDVSMQASVAHLDEVVVTALGIEREQRSLGYDVAQVDGDDLQMVSQENVLSSLAGRVPGVTINQTSGAGSSISVIIRGATSLTTDNQPLFVVDGVPMSNSLNNITEAGSGNQVDYGNAISDISPDDIESVNILKGPSAAALYGTRAGNGVVIITTKSGSKGKALGVSFSTSNVFEQATRLLDFHYKYANGNREGVFNEGSAYWGGPQLDAGNTAVQWNSPLDQNGNPVATELKSYPNAMKDFLQTGFTSTNNIAVSGGGDKGSFRVSYSNMTHQGMIPNSDLFRNNLNTSVDFELLDKLTLSTNFTLGRTHSNDRPSTGDRQANALEAIYASPYIDYSQMRQIWEPGQEEIQQLRTDANDNPYFIAYGINNGFVRDRIFGNVSLNYAFSNNFSVMVRHSLDRINESRETKIPFSFSRMLRGGYFLADIMSQETNSDVLATYKKDLGTVDFNVSAGGNIMHREFSSSSIGSNMSNRNNGLVSPGIYSVQNIPADNLSVNSSSNEKAIYSLYALASIGYADQLYLDLTARNDWSSTLPADNRSYFYPSASLSWLANYTFELPQEISLLKVRGGWAQVGNDTDPYLLQPFLATGNYNAVATASVPPTLLNPNLLPEQATSVEGGIDLNLFNNRIRFSGTYYTIDNENQIFRVLQPQSSGYSSRYINAGLIRSKGWEFTLGATPVQQNGWTWDVNLNWSTNTTTLESLTEDLDFVTLWGENGGGAITNVGDEIGNLYSSGHAYVKDPNSRYYRWPILENGQWVELSGHENMRHVGNVNPDFIMGMQTGITFNRFVLNASFDWRQGGEFMSFTYRYGESDWKSQRQLDNLIPGGNMSADALESLLKSNPEKYIIPQRGNFPRVGGHTAETGGFPVDENGHDGAFVPGVIQTAGADTPDDFSDDEYEEHLGGENTVIYPITDTYPWDFNEQVTFDASFIKLRELSLGYRLPNMGVIRNATFSVYTRNIMLWTKADIGVDPERAFWASGSMQGDTRSQFRQGIERQNVMPWSVSYGFKLNFNL